MRIKLLLAVISIAYLSATLYFERTRSTLDGSDSWGYYVHLPALLLYHDTGDYSKTIAAWQAVYPNKPDPRLDAYGIRPTPLGKPAVKYPIGVAVLESPFFIAAHLYCLATAAFPADGFSTPYAWAAALSSLFFAVFGLFFLYKNLAFYFSERTSLAVTATVGLATNLFFFSSYTLGMAHPVAFFLIAYFLFVTKHWHENPNRRDALWLGLTLGLIALVRTQDAIIGLVPLLWGVRSWRDLPQRVRFFWKHKSSLAFAGLAFVLALLPQAAYWKFVSGQWWFYGYRGETFDWLRPHVLKGLFSFENGWLIYTPVMVFSLWGLLRLRRFMPDLFVPILVFLPLYWYVIYAWWCWMYINGFGSRPMVDTYALLAFPLAAWIESQKRKWAVGLLLCFFVWLNIFQAWQAYRGIYWSERGNWAFYKEVFGKTETSARALAAYESGEIQPSKSLNKAKEMFVHAMADSTSENFVRMEGRGAYRCPGEFNHMTKVSNDTAKLVPGDWLRVSVAALVPRNAPVLSTDHIAKLVIDFTDGGGRLLKYRCLKIVSHIENPTHSLWRTHGTGAWGEAAFFVMVPVGFDAGSQLKTYVWNPNAQEVYVGELRVEVWK